MKDSTAYPPKWVQENESKWVNTHTGFSVVTSDSLGMGLDTGFVSLRPSGESYTSEVNTSGLVDAMNSCDYDFLWTWLERLQSNNELWHFDDRPEDCGFDDETSERLNKGLEYAESVAEYLYPEECAKYVSSPFWQIIESSEDFSRIVGISAPADESEAEPMFTLEMNGAPVPLIKFLSSYCQECLDNEEDADTDLLRAILALQVGESIGEGINMETIKRIS